MRRISSRMTFFNKWVFPAIWFGFPIIFIAIALVSSAGPNTAPPLPFFVGPAIMIAVGFFVMKKLVFDLVDEVWDDGGSLTDQKSRRGGTRRLERHQECQLFAAH
jgi:hypothetical protein